MTKHIMAGSRVFFKHVPTGGTGTSNKRDIGTSVGFNNSGAQMFITEDHDSTYLADFFQTAGGHFGVASATSVYQNIDRIIFDTYHFDYFEFVTSNTSSDINLSAYTLQTTGGKSSQNIPHVQRAEYEIVSHNLGYTPLFTLKSGAYPTIGSSIFIRYGNHSYRHLFPYADNTKIYIREVIYVADASVPALNLGAIDYYLIKTTTTGSEGFPVQDHSTSAGTNRLVVTDNRVQIGNINGKFIFDSNYQYLKKSNTGNIEFFKEQAYGVKVGYSTSLPTSVNHVQCVLYHNVNGVNVYAENSNATASLTYLASTGLDTALGNFQGHTVKYEV